MEIKEDEDTPEIEFVPVTAPIEVPVETPTPITVEPEVPAEPVPV